MPVNVDLLNFDTQVGSQADDGPFLGGSGVNPDGTLVDCGVRFDLNIDDGTRQGCTFKLETFGWKTADNGGRWEVTGPYLNILAWGWCGRFERRNSVLYFYSDATGKVAPNKADFFLKGGAAFATDTRPDKGSGVATNPRNTGWTGSAIAFTRTDPAYLRTP